MNATTKQIEALRNFKVPEDRIQALNIGQASEMLAGLVKRARERKKDSPHPNMSLSYYRQASIWAKQPR